MKKLILLFLVIANSLDNALDTLPVHGYRGFAEFQGGTMADWGKK